LTNAGAMLAAYAGNISHMRLTICLRIMPVVVLQVPDIDHVHTCSRSFINELVYGHLRRQDQEE
jgi:hypothetical protein